MRQEYTSFKFRASSLAMIAKLNGIIDIYREQGYVLTVRQLYYQCVVQNFVANTEKSYKMITGLVNDGRLAGLIDWDAIEDRTRAFNTRGHWDSARSIVQSCARQFHMDMWENQENRVFVVVEKEALISVFERACHDLDVPVLAARGYPSVSVLREFCKNTLSRRHRSGQCIQLLHFGDHDPSGIDMTRDLIDRIELMSEGGSFRLTRLALNMDQVEEERPPPNPAKVTDSRFDSYQQLYGNESWELDALPPRYLEGLAERNIRQFIDEDLWQERVEEIEQQKQIIQDAAEGMKGDV